MKRILFILSVIICLYSCNTKQKENTTISNQEINTKDVCIIDISTNSVDVNGNENYNTKEADELAIDSIHIKDINENIVGVGYYLGSYSVPHNGTMTIYWRDKQYVDINNNKKWVKTWIKHKYVLNVGNANHLEAYIDYLNYSKLYVGRVQVYENEVD